MSMTCTDMVIHKPLLKALKELLDGTDITWEILDGEEDPEHLYSSFNEITIVFFQPKEEK